MGIVTDPCESSSGSTKNPICASERIIAVYCQDRKLSQFSLDDGICGHGNTMLYLAPHRRLAAETIVDVQDSLDGARARNHQNALQLIERHRNFKTRADESIELVQMIERHRNLCVVLSLADLLESICQSDRPIRSSARGALTARISYTSSEP